jgi:hypothetical protein
VQHQPTTLVYVITSAAVLPRRFSPPPKFRIFLRQLPKSDLQISAGVLILLIRQSRSNKKTYHKKHFAKLLGFPSLPYPTFHMVLLQKLGFFCCLVSFYLACGYLSTLVDIINYELYPNGRNTFVLSLCHQQITTLQCTFYNLFVVGMISPYARFQSGMTTHRNIAQTAFTF